MACMHVCVSVAYVVFLWVHVELLANFSLFNLSLLPCHYCLLHIKEVLMKVSRKVTFMTFHLGKPLQNRRSKQDAFIILIVPLLGLLKTVEVFLDRVGFLYFMNKFAQLAIVKAYYREVVQQRLMFFVELH